MTTAAKATSIDVNVLKLADEVLFATNATHLKIRRKADRVLVRPATEIASDAFPASVKNHGTHRVVVDGQSADRLNLRGLVGKRFRVVKSNPRNNVPAGWYELKLHSDMSEPLPGVLFGGTTERLVSVTKRR